MSRKYPKLSDELEHYYPYGKALNAHQWTIVRLAAQGLTNPEIGEELHLSGDTIKRQMQFIFSKTGLTNRIQLALWAFTQGILKQLTPESEDRAKVVEHVLKDFLLPATFKAVWDLPSEANSA